MTLVLTINDHGGLIGTHVALGKAYAAAGVHVAVKYCASACLFLLMQMPHSLVCFYPDAWIGYHTSAAYPNAKGICCEESTTTMRWERGADWIARGYAKCV
jgi:hypothetical protein